MRHGGNNQNIMSECRHTPTFIIRLSRRQQPARPSKVRADLGTSPPAKDSPDLKEVSRETEQSDEAEAGSVNFVRGTLERARRCSRACSDRGGCAAEGGAVGGYQWYDDWG